MSGSSSLPRRSSRLLSNILPSHDIFILHVKPNKRFTRNFFALFAAVPCGYLGVALVFSVPIYINISEVKCVCVHDLNF